MTKATIKNMTNEELEQAVLVEKSKGTSDFEIGKKYRVNLKFIEKVVMTSTRINVWTLTISQ